MGILKVGWPQALWLKQTTICLIYFMRLQKENQPCSRSAFRTVTTWGSVEDGTAVSSVPLILDFRFNTCPELLLEFPEVGDLHVLSWV